MSGDITYLLDANVFIEAHRRYYAFDLCPSFWNALAWLQSAGRILSIDRVKEESERGGDDLADWAKNKIGAGCFTSTDQQDVIEWFGRMVAWVQPKGSSCLRRRRSLHQEQTRG